MSPRFHWHNWYPGRCQTTDTFLPSKKFLHKGSQLVTFSSFWETSKTRCSLLSSKIKTERFLSDKLIEYLRTDNPLFKKFYLASFFSRLTSRRAMVGRCCSEGPEDHGWAKGKRKTPRLTIIWLVKAKVQEEEFSCKFTKGISTAIKNETAWLTPLLVDQRLIVWWCDGAGDVLSVWIRLTKQRLINGALLPFGCAQGQIIKSVKNETSIRKESKKKTCAFVNLTATSTVMAQSKSQVARVLAMNEVINDLFDFFRFSTSWSQLFLFSLFSQISNGRQVKRISRRSKTWPKSVHWPLYKNR